MPWGFLAVLAAMVFGAGCATSTGTERHGGFDFDRDSLAFDNRTRWSYGEDPETGRTIRRRVRPTPEYTHRCFVMVRAAKQFLGHARFEPENERVSDRDYRRAVRKVMRRSARRVSPEDRRIAIPGFEGLREFGRVHEAMLKREMGGAWQSFLQRGNWRMLLAFPEAHQERLADALAARLESDPPGPPAVLHVVRFPSLTINHALLAYAVESGPEGHRFVTYDPNDASTPVELVFDRETRRFALPRVAYFPGGRVDVYEVYRSVWY